MVHNHGGGGEHQQSNMIGIPTFHSFSELCSQTLLSMWGERLEVRPHDMSSGCGR